MKDFSMVPAEGDSEDEFDSDTEGEISDGVNPVNDPPTASQDDSIRNSVSRGVWKINIGFWQFIRKIILIFSSLFLVSQVGLNLIL
ncbi:hypothetical protein HRED_09102 [Candidatus Haloredivivus sp. G17]|nr:hypothetical protein HRED_09102 [Candidatus Haloredivivus sp. G17]